MPANYNVSTISQLAFDSQLVNQLGSDQLKDTLQAGIVKSWRELRSCGQSSVTPQEVALFSAPASDSQEVASQRSKREATAISRYCGTCPVRKLCYMDAVLTHEKSGVHGARQIDLVRAVNQREQQGKTFYSITQI